MLILSELLNSDCYLPSNFKVTIVVLFMFLYFKVPKVLNDMGG